MLVKGVVAGERGWKSILSRSAPTEAERGTGAVFGIAGRVGILPVLFFFFLRGGRAGVLPTLSLLSGELEE